MSMCKLCESNQKLVKSHIIPEWAYTSMYDDKHRFYKKVLGNKGFSSFPKSGEYDRILCNECENYFNIYDDYGRAVIYSKPGEPTYNIIPKEADYGVNLYNINYDRLKIFQLSILWRAAVSTRTFFKDITLGKDVKVIRDLILSNESVNSESFGCIMAAILIDKNTTFDKVIDSPTIFCSNGWKLARFFFAGCVWLFVLDENASKFPLKEFFLEKGEPLRIHLGPLEKLPGFIKRLKYL